MITDYGDQATYDVHFGLNTREARSIPQELWPICRRKLNRIDQAAALKDLVSPGNNLEKLAGNLAGFWSIRVNEQWRIVFKFWDNGSASEVTITDYH